MRTLSPTRRGLPFQRAGKLVRLVTWMFPINFPTLSGYGALGIGASFTYNLVNDPGTVSVFEQIGIASDGPFTLQLTPSESARGIFNGPVHSGTIICNLDRPGKLAVPIRVTGSNSIQVAVTNLHTAVNNIYLTLQGFREYSGGRDCPPAG